eukprot:TRINITY_DN21411_c0_g1_i1.p1 TRINITY_DN21411_c0_g1~~TRINITY_DN21411_c0_g1_i1.p1  ORF type:complete len:706 (+),score=212.39 TRINITY_DN21411_c0_g1_i1:43-2160(+)
MALLEGPSKEGEPWAEKFRDKVRYGDSREVGVEDCVWECFQSTTGFNVGDVKRLVEGKMCSKQAVEEVPLSYGVFDPQRLLDFAKSISHETPMAHAIAELKRRMHHHTELSIRGIDLARITSEADLEAGVRSRSSRAKITDLTTQKEIMKLKQFLTTHTATSDDIPSLWTDPSTIRALRKDLIDYSNTLRSYTKLLEVRSSYPHGVHDDNENTKYRLLRSEEASQRLAISPAAIESRLERLQLSKRRISKVVNSTASKYPNLLEMSLSGNQIKVLENMPHNLSVLHMCGNQVNLIHPTGLPSNLIHLGLAYNKLTNVKGLQDAGILRSLDISHNLLCDIDEIQRLLHVLKQLQKVVLKGNPFTLLPYYRQMVIKDSLLGLSVLDDIPITPEERNFVGRMQFTGEVFGEEKKEVVVKDGAEVGEQEERKGEEDQADREVGKDAEKETPPIHIRIHIEKIEGLIEKEPDQKEEAPPVAAPAKGKKAPVQAQQVQEEPQNQRSIYLYNNCTYGGFKTGAIEVKGTTVSVGERIDMKVVCDKDLATWLLKVHTIEVHEVDGETDQLLGVVNTEFSQALVSAKAADDWSGRTQSVFQQELSLQHNTLLYHAKYLEKCKAQTLITAIAGACAITAIPTSLSPKRSSSIRKSITNSASKRPSVPTAPPKEEPPKPPQHAALPTTTVFLRVEVNPEDKEEDSPPPPTPKKGKK